MIKTLYFKEQYQSYYSDSDIITGDYCYFNGTIYYYDGRNGGFAPAGTLFYVDNDSLIKSMLFSLDYLYVGSSSKITGD